MLKTALRNENRSHKLGENILKTYLIKELYLEYKTLITQYEEN